MKTIVYQSYRTSRVEPWIATCMKSVKAWAESKDFEYRFFDDSFFEYAPDWYRDKVNHQICPVTDLARLVAAKEFLANGYERTIWIDADMLVFAPEKLAIDLESDFTFCHEVWMVPEAAGTNHVSHRVNNSVTAFCKGNVHLDFFIDACQRIARHKPEIGKLDVGTLFLTQLRNALPFPLLENVGMLSPALMTDIALDMPHRLIEYARHLSAPLACANLCGSLQGQNFQGAVADDSIYEKAIDTLLSDRGESINRHVTSRRQQQ
ncbi:MAG: hypothetical protein K8R92_01300 [Planctomycetes bacterium]|nr:hypothetical protein [Planctomycetota bacterium]